jgi:hypothetical protein
VNTHGEAIETRSLFIRHFNVDVLHADSILPERKASAAMFRLEQAALQRNVLRAPTDAVLQWTRN